MGSKASVASTSMDASQGLQGKGVRWASNASKESLGRGFGSMASSFEVRRESECDDSEWGDGESVVPGRSCKRAPIVLNKQKTGMPRGLHHAVTKQLKLLDRDHQRNPILEKVRAFL